MPLFSAFTPFGMLKFSNAPSRGERIYRAMYAAKAGAFNLSPGSYQEAKVYAQAMGIARGRYALERAFNNQNPFKSIELLPVLEKNWSVIPSETDTLLQRQLNVAAAMMLVRGATREAITAGLQAILTSHFIALRTFLPGEVTADQPTGSDGPLFARHDLPFKVIRLTGPVTQLGAPSEVTYENADPSAGPILVQKDDIFMVQPENIGRAEPVTIVSATATALIATFTKSHDTDCYATTQNWVNWTSTQRVYLIIVDDFAALDAEMVRRVDDFMSKVARGVSTWDIVEPTTPGAPTIGPFTLDASPLGAVPLGSMTIIPPVPPDFAPMPSTLTTVGGPMRLFGRHLLATTDVKINAVSVPFSIISDYEILVTVPATFPAALFGPPNVYSIQVLNPNGNVFSPTGLTILPALFTVSSITPDTGPPNVSTIIGTGFLALSDISENGFSVSTPWTVVDDVTITDFTADAYGSAGVHNVDFLDGFGRTTSFPFNFTA